MYYNKGTHFFLGFSKTPPLSEQVQLCIQLLRNRTVIASFPGSAPQLFFAPCKKIATLHFSYCKQQKLEWRPGSEARTVTLP